MRSSSIASTTTGTCQLSCGRPNQSPYTRSDPPFTTPISGRSARAARSVLVTRPCTASPATRAVPLPVLRCPGSRRCSRWPGHRATARTAREESSAPPEARRWRAHSTWLRACQKGAFRARSWRVGELEQPPSLVVPTRARPRGGPRTRRRYRDGWLQGGRPGSRTAASWSYNSSAAAVSPSQAATSAQMLTLASQVKSYTGWWNSFSRAMSSSGRASSSRPDSQSATAWAAWKAGMPGLSAAACTTRGRMTSSPPRCQLMLTRLAP